MSDFGVSKGSNNRKSEELVSEKPTMRSLEEGVQEEGALTVKKY